MNNRDLKEYEAWFDEQNSPFTQFKKNLNAVQIIALVGAIYLAWYMLKTGGSNSKWYLIGLAVVILIILFKPKKAPEQEPIPEHVIKVLAKIQLDRKVGHDTEFPTGTVISIMPECGMRFQGEWGELVTPWKWEVGFRAKNQEGLEKEYLCVLHAYRGYITGIKYMKYGYDGTVSNDMKILMPSILKPEGQAGTAQPGLSVTKK